MIFACILKCMKLFRGVREAMRYIGDGVVDGSFLLWGDGGGAGGGQMVCSTARRRQEVETDRQTDRQADRPNDR